MRAVVDLEANGFLETVDKIWCMVAKDIDTKTVHKFGPDDLNKMIGFLDKCTVVIGHNFLGYDTPLLSKILGYQFREDVFIIDTYILSQMLEPDRKKHPKTTGKKGAHSLENIGNYLKRHKPEHEDWSQYSPEMLHRCSEDVEINYLEFVRLNHKAQLFTPNSRWIKPYKIEAAFQKVINKQVSKGILVNKPKLLENILFLDDEIRKVDEEVLPKLPMKLVIHEQKKDGEWQWNKKPFKGNGELNKYTVDWCNLIGCTNHSIVGGPFTRISFEHMDLGSVQEVKNYLLTQGWVPLKWNKTTEPLTGTEKRTSPKMDKEEEFLGVEGDVGKRVAYRMVCRHRRSQLQGFLDKLRTDGRISAAITGITPTVRCKHAVVVNIPGEDAFFGQQMREIFTVPEGYKMVGCDAVSCQLRNLCHHMGDDEYTDAVINGDKDLGTDIHTVNQKAAGLFNRTQAKRFIYGFLFGAGDEKVGLITGSNRAGGKKIKKQFLNNLPKLAALIDRITRQFKTYKYLVGLDGRLIFPRSAHQALCYQLQSDEAIMMKVATIYLDSWITQEGLDAHQVAHMHDEFQFEVRDDHAKRLAELAPKAVEKAGKWLKMNVPMAGSASIGQTWWDTH